jgi:hypothetical protein
MFDRLASTGSATATSSATAPWCKKVFVNPRCYMMQRGFLFFEPRCRKKLYPPDIMKKHF